MFFTLLNSPTYLPAIFRYIHFRYPFLSYDTIEDVLQETSCRLLQLIRKPGFDPREPLRIVYRIAYFVATEASRKHGHLPKPLEDPSSVPGISEGHDLPFIDSQDWDKFSNDLWNVLLHLTELQRTVVSLYLDQIDSFTERNLYRPLTAAVSRATGKRLECAAVRSALRRGLAKVQKELIRLGWLKAGEVDWRSRT